MSGSLEARGLTFGYGGRRPARRGQLAGRASAGLTPDGSRAPLIRGLDLEIAEGEFVGILGANGAGKTTLLRLLCGSLQPVEGCVRLFGRPLPDITPIERAKLMAFVPQESRPAFDFTALDLVLMGRTPHLGFFGIEGRRDIEIAREALDFTDTLPLAARPFASLSAGERQRVTLARALAQQARVVLLDEPTAFLDLGHQHRIYGLLSRLCRERGATLVVVSHEIALAGRYCDRLIVMREGEPLADGPAGGVLTPELIRAAYGVKVRVEHPAGLGPVIIALGVATQDVT